MIYDTVKLFLEKYHLLQPQSYIIVAFSGGYDSLCLLDVMKKISQEYDLNLIAVHLNHNWRGEESDNEECRCKKICSDITFYSEKLPSGIPHTETAAREARYDFLWRCAKKFNSKAVLTAHNANDNAETVFYRLIKGTGLTGLEGIKEHRGIYYRPLLEIYRDEIEKYCYDNALLPNNDSSNTNVKYTRNKIRHEIFPQLKSISPDFEIKLNKLSKSAQFADKIIEKHVKALEQYTTGEFCGLNPELQSCVIHKFLRDNSLDYDSRKIANLTLFINKNKNSKAGKTCSLAANLWLFANNREIKVITKIAAPVEEICINRTGKYETGRYIFTIEPADELPGKFPQDKDYAAYVNLKEIDFTLRARHAGDIISPLGAGGTQKLKKYLNEKGIAKHEKDSVILLCKYNEVLWAAGLGISEKIKVVTKPTHMLKLEKKGKNNGN